MKTLSMRTPGMDFMALAKQQVALFEGDNVGYSELLVNSKCPRSILNMAYNRLVREGKLIAVEAMYTEDQVSVGEMAKGFAKGRLKRAELIDLVRALIAIEFFLNIEKN